MTPKTSMGILGVSFAVAYIVYWFVEYAVPAMVK